MDPIMHGAVIAVCLVVSAFFSSSETALLRLNEEEVDHDVREDGGPAVTATQRLLASTSRLLVTILLGSNVVNIRGRGARWLGAVCAGQRTKARRSQHPLWAERSTIRALPRGSQR